MFEYVDYRRLSIEGSDEILVGTNEDFHSLQSVYLTKGLTLKLDVPRRRKSVDMKGLAFSLHVNETFFPRARPSRSE